MCFLDPLPSCGVFVPCFQMSSWCFCKGQPCCDPALQRSHLPSRGGPQTPLSLRDFLEPTQRHIQRGEKMRFLGVGVAFVFPPQLGEAAPVWALQVMVSGCALCSDTVSFVDPDPRQPPLPQPKLCPHAGLVVLPNVLQYQPGPQKRIGRLRSSAQKACPRLNPSSAASLCCQSQCCDPSCLAQLTQHCCLLIFWLEKTMW